MHIKCCCKCTGGLRVTVWRVPQRGRCGSWNSALDGHWSAPDVHWSAPGVHWSAPGVHHSDNPLHICTVIALMPLVLFCWPHLCVLSVSLYCFQKPILCTDCLEIEIIICCL